MVQMIMCRNLDVPEVCKFEAMLGWARNKIRMKSSSKMDSKLEFKCIMERLARDLKLYRISPQELIKVCQFAVFVQWFVIATVTVLHRTKILSSPCLVA
jgi:hypothetical protein